MVRAAPSSPLLHPATCYPTMGIVNKCSSMGHTQHLLPRQTPSCLLVLGLSRDPQQLDGSGFNTRAAFSGEETTNTAVSCCLTNIPSSSMLSDLHLLTPRVERQTAMQGTAPSLCLVCIPTQTLNQELESCSACAQHTFFVCRCLQLSSPWAITASFSDLSSHLTH